MADTPARAAVVGAGVVGLTAASELADRRVAVTLYDRAAPGSGATGRAAGLCYDAYVERTDARLAARSLDYFRTLGVVTDRPYVWVAREGDDHVAAAVREQATRMRQRGREVSVATPAELADRFDVRTDHLAVGAVAENAGYVDTGAFLDAAVQRARSAGVTIRPDCPAELAAERRLTTPDGTDEFDAVLVAAGPHTPSLVADAGVDLAVATYRAQALVTEACAADPPLYYDASREFYIRPDGDGVLVGDGAHPYDGDPDAVDGTADAGFVDESLARAETALGVRPTVDRSWAGLCTATPDRDPLVGAVRSGLYVATGWHGHGFMRGPAIGRRVAEEMLGGDGIDHFDPARFDGDEPIHLPEGIVD